MGQTDQGFKRGGGGRRKEKKKIQKQVLCEYSCVLFFSLWIVISAENPFVASLSFFFQPRQQEGRCSATTRRSDTVPVIAAYLHQGIKRTKRGAGYQNERAEAEKGQSPLGLHASQHVRRRSAGRDCTAGEPGSAGTGLSSWGKGEGQFKRQEGGNDVMNGGQEGTEGKKEETEWSRQTRNACRRRGSS